MIIKYRTRNYKQILIVNYALKTILLRIDGYL